MTAANGPGRSRGTAALWVLALVVVAALILAIGRNQSDGTPYDPFSISEDGTQALVRVLKTTGADVDVRKGTPDASNDIALVLVDRYRSEDPDFADDYFDQQVAIRRWVDEGGTLVVADPSSPLMPAGLSGFGIPGTQCDIAALAGIREIDPELGVTPLRVSADNQFCFGDGGEAVVVKADSGDGSIVGVGTRRHWENEHIGSGDHGALAVALLAPSSDTSVVVLTGPSGVVRKTRTLSDLASPGVKWGLALGAFGFVIFALGKVPRHGRPVQEPQLVEIAGSELVGATGRMFERSKVVPESAETLRLQALRDLATGLHMPATAPSEQVIAAVAARSGDDSSRVATLLSQGNVHSEEQLAAFARDLEQLRRAVLGQPTMTTQQSTRETETV